MNIDCMFDVFLGCCMALDNANVADYVDDDDDMLFRGSMPFIIIMANDWYILLSE